MEGPEITDDNIVTYIIGADMHNDQNWPYFLKNKPESSSSRLIYLGDALSKNDFRPDRAESNVNILETFFGKDSCLMGDHDKPDTYDSDNIGEMEQNGYVWARGYLEQHKKSHSKEEEYTKNIAAKMVRAYENKIKRSTQHSELSEKSREFLSCLQDSLVFPVDGTKAAFFHDDFGKYKDDDIKHDILGIYQILRNMERENVRVACRGHLHADYITHQNESGNIVIEPINETTEEIPLNKDWNYIFGVGALSRLQKLDVRGGYARTYYTKKHEISFGIIRYYKDTHDLTFQMIVEQI